MMSLADPISTEPHVVVSATDRSIAKLALIDRILSRDAIRRALEDLVVSRAAGATELTLSDILLDRKLLDRNQVDHLRRTRARAVLRCTHCAIRQTVEPFDPKASHTCTTCGRLLALGEAGIRGRSARSPETVRRSRRDLDPSVTPLSADSPADGDGASSNAPPDELDLIGQPIEGYLVTRLIGRGGMASVYEAAMRPAVGVSLPHGTERRAAIKVLSQTTAANTEYVRRFFREADMARRLRHPNLIDVWASGQVRNWVYLTMPFIEGETLQKRLQRTHPLPIAETVGHIVAALDGIEAAHRLGILHRDLKPDNLLLIPSGQLKVLDFGLARDQIDLQITAHGQTVGTPRFMPPEQWRDLALKPSADIHALGITLYYLLAAHFPYPKADTSLGFYYSMIENEPRPLRRWRPEVSPELEAVILRMMARDPRRRHQAAIDARDALMDACPEAGPWVGASASTSAIHLSNGSSRSRSRSGSGAELRRPSTRLALLNPLPHPEPPDRNAWNAKTVGRTRVGIRKEGPRPRHVTRRRRYGMSRWARLFSLTMWWEWLTRTGPARRPYDRSRRHK